MSQITNRNNFNVYTILKMKKEKKSNLYEIHQLEPIKMTFIAQSIVLYPGMGSMTCELFTTSFSLPLI